MTTETVNEEFSNIVTPPDFVFNANHSVVLIDPEMSEIEDIAFYLKTAKKAFNVYVYKTDMGDEQWLAKAISESMTVVINTVQNENSLFKDKMAVKRDAFYYGPKRFLMNNNRLEKPIDYFVQIDSDK